MAKKVSLAPVESEAATRRTGGGRFARLRDNSSLVVGAVALLGAGLVGGLLIGGARGHDGRDHHDGRGGFEMRGGPAAPHGDDRDGDAGMRGGPAGAPQGGEASGTVASVSGSQVTVTRADGTTVTLDLSGVSVYVSQAGSAADVVAGSSAWITPASDAGSGAFGELASIAVSATALPAGEHLHLGIPVTVDSVSGSTIAVTPVGRGGAGPIGGSTSATIGSATTVRKVSAASLADIAVGASVEIDLFRGDTAKPESVVIVR